MSKMIKKDVVEEQYENSRKLSIRLMFQKNYRTNPISYQDWLYGNYDLFEGCKILEIGCGTGAFWEGKLDLLPKGVEITLSDISQGMVDIVKEKFSSYSNMNFTQIDIQEIPFADEMFDFVIANSMLYHVPDIPRALDEVHRVLKKRGKFFCATNGVNGLNQFLHKKLREFNPDIKAFDEGSVTFTMQNGRGYLEECFPKIKILHYDNILKVTKVEDLVEYIESTIPMSGITEEQMLGLDVFFEKIRKEENVICIPSDAGTFISEK